MTLRPYLYQFQCQVEGDLFYYQSGMSQQFAEALIEHCPVCGSRKVGLTGRVYRAVDQAPRSTRGR